MQFASPLLSGTLIKRYKRFFADVELDDGTIVTAHCPNTGAMTGCAEPGFKVFLSESDNPKRKLKFTWELAQNFEGEMIGINTHNANKLVSEALDNRIIKQLPQFESYKHEVSVEGVSSRFDFALYTPEEHYLEVKSVTLARKNKGFFPDAVTSRGARHCEELAALCVRGIPTTLLFCVQHTQIKSVQIARDVDENYARSVEKAVAAGVQIIAVGCEITKQKIAINQTLPIEM